MLMAFFDRSIFCESRVAMVAVLRCGCQSINNRKAMETVDGKPGGTVLETMGSLEPVMEIMTGSFLRRSQNCARGSVC